MVDPSIHSFTPLASRNTQDERSGEQHQILFRSMAHRLNVIAIMIKHKSTIIIWTINFPYAWLAIINTTNCNCCTINASTAARLEARKAMCILVVGDLSSDIIQKSGLPSFPKPTTPSIGSISIVYPNGSSTFI